MLIVRYARPQEHFAPTERGHWIAVLNYKHPAPPEHRTKFVAALSLRVPLLIQVQFAPSETSPIKYRTEER